MNPIYQPGRAWSIALMLAVLNLVNFLDKIVIGMVAVPMREELSLSPVQFGVIGGAIFWLFAVAGIAGGFLANRFPTRWLLLGMALLWSAVQLPMIYASSMVVIVIARVLLGVGEGPCAAVSFHACYKWFPNDKRNLPATVINLGASLGVLIAGVSFPLITARWGWRANFVVLGIIGVVWALAWLLVGREGPLEGDEEITEVTSLSSGKHQPYSRLLTDRTVLGAALMTFVSYWGLVVTLTWMTTYLQKGLSYDAVTSGRMFALVVLLGIPVTLGLSAGSQRLMARGASSRKARVVLGGLALVAAGGLFVVPTFLALTPLHRVLLIAVASGLSQVVFALAPALVGEVVPSAQRASVLSIEIALGTLGGILSPIVMGYFMEAAGTDVARGYENGLALSGLLLVGGGLLVMLLIDPERSKRRLLHSQT